MPRENDPREDVPREDVPREDVRPDRPCGLKEVVQTGRLRLVLLTKLLKCPERLSRTDSNVQISTFRILRYHIKAIQNPNPNPPLLSFWTQNWSQKMND